jgi:hypothetical protein
MSFTDYLSFLGMILRLVGLLVFGVAAGWFTLYAFRQPDHKWQLQIAVFLGFLLMMALTLRFTSPGGAGAFALGAGAALLYWGKRIPLPPTGDEDQ